MEKTKVVSFRLPESLVTKLDDAAKGSIWWKRNTVVVNILQNVLDHADANSRRLLIREAGWSNVIESIEVKTREK